MAHKLEDLNLVKRNYRNNKVLVLGGLTFILLTLLFWLILYQLNYLNFNLLGSYIYFTLVIGATGFLDDICGDKNAQGLKGHFNALLKGDITTGIIKVVVITLSAILIILKQNNFSFFADLIDIGIIVLMTNLLNLLDLRPGRSIKFFLLVSVFVFLLNKAESWLYFLPYYLAILFYLPYELKENIMLGDTGANLLGFVLGYNLILLIGNISFKSIILGLILIMTLLSEKYSFNKIIKNNKVLNWIDQIGRIS